MQSIVRNLTDYHIGLWSKSRGNVLPDVRTFSAIEKTDREELVDYYIAKFRNKSSLLKYKNNKSEFKFKARMALKHFFVHCFDFSEDEAAIVLSNEFSDSAGDFMKMAKEFDADVSTEDVYQASRNLWIVNTLQYLMGEGVELTPAIFGYSMLYPYTDNYIDDPEVDVDEKAAFSKRFGKRLRGEFVIPANDHEKKIFDLVRMIEETYCRHKYPEVFQSLVAIHDAQFKSIRLVNSCNVEESELLEVCIEKGGTSVLADGYLVNGYLTEDQQRFMYGFGTWLQFLDDIQDIFEDIDGQLTTYFTHAAENDNLEKVIGKTIDFGNKVLEDMNCFKGTGTSRFKNLMLKSITVLLTEAVGKHSIYLSSEHVACFERYSPFSFDFINKRKTDMKKSSRLSVFKKIEPFLWSETTNKKTAQQEMDIRNIVN